MNQLIKDITHLLFPRLCAVCRQVLSQTENNICLHCSSMMPYTYDWMDIYKNPTTEAISWCGSISGAAALINHIKGGRYAQLVYQLKYGGKLNIGIELGEMLGFYLKEAKIECDMLIPVPIHKRRHRQRGYNQSLQIAKGLSLSLEKPIEEHALIRKEYRKSQVSLGSRVLRLRNVDDVFECTDKDRIAGKRIVLVDDVITTGATVHACAQKLRAGGCANVSVVAIAHGS